MFCFLLISCARPFLKVSPNLQKPNNAPTLVATMYINANPNPPDPDEDETPAPSLSETLEQTENLSLDESGEIFYSMTESFFAKEGFAIFEDKTRVEKNNLIKGNDAQQLKTVAQVLSGIWYSQGSSTVDINNNTILFKFTVNDVVKRFDSDVPDEYFLFATTRIYRDQHWFKVRPRIIVDYVVISDQKEVVMRARGVGYGESNFFVLDRSPQNLKIALKESIESIMDSERKPL